MYMYLINTNILEPQWLKIIICNVASVPPRNGKTITLKLHHVAVNSFDRLDNSVVNEYVNIGQLHVALTFITRLKSA